MSDTTSFGSVATTIIFSIIISIAIITLFTLTFFGTKYSFREMVGIYDPVIKSWNRYAFMLDDDAIRLIQPYVTYHGRTYFMFGNQNVGNLRNKVKKIEVLTEFQLNEFFPLKTYEQWMNGGKEEIQNLNKGKLGYRENFDAGKLLGNDSPLGEIDQEVTNLEINKSLFDLRQTLEPKKSTQKSIIKSSANLDQTSIHSELQEQDIVDMIPTKKIQYTIAALSIQSNNSPLEAEKHYSSGICAICLEDLNDNDRVRGLLCGHVFHDLCIDPWLTERKGCCPTCKKDLYVEVTNFENQIDVINNNVHDDTSDNASSNNRGLNVNVNDVIHLPVGEPGSRDIDELFNLDEHNSFSFFLILIITKLKSDILLCALQYIRNNNYSLDNENDNIGINETNESEDIIDFTENISLASDYCKKFEKKFEQQNVLNSFKTPPLPDLNKFNPQIKKIIEHHPRPFQPADLIDLDTAAWKETKRMSRGIRRLAFKALDISSLDLYYHNVVKIYNKRRVKRLST